NDLTLPIHSSSTTSNKDVAILAVNPTLQRNSEVKAKKVEKPKSAKRLADTKTLSHQDWLAVRNQGIGGSDAAAACGLN
ncbi:hypothetical protein, partial [Mycobacterium tuberculosis]|uniref:hypothetical protein n=1 Tax=Mycobacterium tuberculosis TaxID=1773 RepID=UPI001AE87F6A|nr:hypothetical protein [Mycobacterium tuberculosis]